MPPSEPHPVVSISKRNISQLGSDSGPGVPHGGQIRTGSGPDVFFSQLLSGSVRFWTEGLGCYQPGTLGLPLVPLWATTFWGD